MIENIIGNSNTNIFQLKKWTIILLWDTGRSEVIKPNQHLYRNKTTYFKYFVFCRLIFFLLFGSIANFEFGIEKYFFFFWTSFLFAAKSTSYQKLFRQPWYLVRVHDTISYISKVVHFACLHVFNICVFTARQEIALHPSVQNEYTG